MSEQKYQQALDNIKERDIDIWSATITEIVSLDNNIVEDIIFILEMDAEVLRQAISKLAQDESHRSSDLVALAKEAKRVEDRINILQICFSLLGGANPNIY